MEVLYPATSGSCVRQSPSPALVRIASIVEEGGGRCSCRSRISSTSSRLCQKLALRHTEDPHGGASKVLPCPR
eukprot:scaffold89153_cov22-Prasinocladus_malaysianus.AAC.1